MNNQAQDSTRSGSEQAGLERASWRQPAWHSSQYELLDFGAGRKLERIGGVVLDRACPAANAPPQQRRAIWDAADVRLDGQGKLVSGTLPDTSWVATFANVTLNLKLTPFGHVGLFPEQSSNWRWMHRQVCSEVKRSKSTIAALNLFAYTGGSTFALASAGASVVHLDASAPAVAWARRNAVTSCMQDLPIRWIVEDARKFVARELRRGNRYDIIVLDPPSYGHGPGGKSWKLERDLEPLLAECLQLLNDCAQSALLVTAHCSHPDMRTVVEMLDGSLAPRKIAFGRLTLEDLTGRSLDAGFYVRSGDASKE